ncbi:MAG: hypothetical protein IPL61_36275 [Myxococcales bacterium]|nr:hypothetical protein [Myxococcales bacterium]
MRSLLLPLIAAAACGGPARAYPRWSLDSGTHLDHGCLDADAFVRTSGKTGVGVTVALRSHATCAVTIARAELVVDDLRVAAELPPVQTLPGRSLIYAWLPFPFDNNGAWNDGKRRGQFELEVIVGDGARATWIIPAHHAFASGRYEPGPGAVR